MDVYTEGKHDQGLEISGNAILVEDPRVDVSTYSMPLMNMYSTLASFIIRY